MYAIYDYAGNVVGYYDDQFLAYDASQNPIMANGAQAIYDPNNNVLIDATQLQTAVSPSTPPAGVSSTDWVKLFTDAVPKVITGLQAWQLSQINVQRASQGLPPLNAALYAPGQAGFLANMSSQTLLLIAAGVGLFLVMGKKGR